MRQESVLGPLLFCLFTVVLEALSGRFGRGLPWELFCAYDLVFLAESGEILMEEIKTWKEGLESGGLGVSVERAGVMKCRLGAGVRIGSGRCPCGMCGRGVGRNSIQCGGCEG